jgi:hypothetical protein
VFWTWRDIKIQPLVHDPLLKNTSLYFRNRHWPIRFLPPMDRCRMRFAKKILSASAWLDYNLLTALFFVCVIHQWFFSILKS